MKGVGVKGANVIVDFSDIGKDDDMGIVNDRIALYANANNRKSDDVWHLKGVSSATFAHFG